MAITSPPPMALAMPGQWPLDPGATASLMIFLSPTADVLGRNSTLEPITPPSSSGSSQNEMFSSTSNRSSTSSRDSEIGVPSSLTVEHIGSEMSTLQPDWRRFEPPKELLNRREVTSPEIRNLLAPSIERIKTRYEADEERRAAAARGDWPLVPIRVAQKSGFDLSSASSPNANSAGGISVSPNDSGYGSQSSSSSVEPSVPLKSRGRKSFDLSSMFKRKTGFRHSFGFMNGNGEVSTPPRHDIPIHHPLSRKPVPTAEPSTGTALESETHWPVKCCLNIIPVDTIRPHISPEMKFKYNIRHYEWGTPAGERVYCSQPNCNAQLATIQQHVVTRRRNENAREARARADAEEERIILQMVADFEQEEAERLAREAEVQRRREVEERRRLEDERIAAVNLRFHHLTTELDTLHDVQRVLIAERYEFETEVLKKNRQDALDTLAVRHASEMQILGTESQKKISDSEYEVKAEYQVRLAEERRIEDQYVDDLRAYWAGKPEGEAKIKQARDELRRDRDKEYQLWNTYRRNQLAALVDSEKRKMEALKQRHGQEIVDAETAARDFQKQWRVRVWAEKRWVEEVLLERREMLQALELEDIPTIPLTGTFATTITGLPFVLPTIPITLFPGFPLPNPTLPLPTAALPTQSLLDLPLPTIPFCLIPCLEESITATTSCQAEDIVCACSAASQDVISGISDLCIAQACGEDLVDQIKEEKQQLCALLLARPPSFPFEKHERDLLTPSPVIVSGSISDASTTTALNPDAIPTCAQSCIVAAVKSATNCGLSDILCQCESENTNAIADAAENCVVSACGIEQALALLDDSKAICASASADASTASETVVPITSNPSTDLATSTAIFVSAITTASSVSLPSLPPATAPLPIVSSLTTSGPLVYTFNPPDILTSTVTAAATNIDPESSSDLASIFISIITVTVSPSLIPTSDPPLSTSLTSGISTSGPAEPCNTPFRLIIIPDPYTYTNYTAQYPGRLPLYLSADGTAVSSCYQACNFTILAPGYLACSSHLPNGSVGIKYYGADYSSLLPTGISTLNFTTAEDELPGKDLRVKFAVTPVDGDTGDAVDGEGVIHGRLSWIPGHEDFVEGYEGSEARFCSDVGGGIVKEGAGVSGYVVGSTGFETGCEGVQLVVEDLSN
ncbi:hypothetical protein B7494_g5576 [Chlorociboria aeruginascens]|nr:hypothetical protein B7494_g5576 [Chlorociboria aeruginascens]